jgi:hypothetical protein
MVLPMFPCCIFLVLSFSGMAFTLRYPLYSILFCRFLVLFFSLVFCSRHGAVGAFGRLTIIMAVTIWLSLLMRVSMMYF